MPPTLYSLIQNESLGLQVWAGHGQLSRLVQWVHVSELVDPTPYLEGGELLLTLGLELPHEPAPLSEYVHRLADRGVCALGVGTGFGFASMPDAVVRAGGTFGLPILEVPVEVPFLAVAKTVFSSLLHEEQRAATMVFRAQQRLVAAAISDDNRAQILAQLAKELSGWAVLTDSRGHQIEASAALDPELRHEIADIVHKLHSKGTRATGALAFGADQIVIHALRTGRPARFLVTGMSRPFTTQEHAVVNMAASLLALALEQVRSRADERRRLAGIAYTLFRSQGRGAAQPLAEFLGWHPPSGHIQVAVVKAASVRAVEAGLAESALPESVLVTQLASDDDEPHIALLIPAGWDITALTGTVLARAQEAAIGVSSAASPPDDLETAERQALSAVRHGVRAGKRVMFFDDLASDGLFAMLDTSSIDVARTLLEPLIRYDQDHGGDLVLTVRTWLNHHAQWQPAADELGIHRHTLRYRVRLAERLLGHSFDSARDRLETLLSLELLDFYTHAS